MNINMTEKIYDDLINACRNSKKELSGELITKIDNEEIYITGISFDEDEIIKEYTNKSISYNNKEYITKTMHGIISSTNGVYICFHTHPSFGGIPALSEKDKETLKYTQELSTKLSTEVKSITDIKPIEGIVTSTEIAFYSINTETNEIIRIPLFVDGIEKIPSTEKSTLQRIKDSFISGMNRAKR